MKTFNLSTSLRIALMKFIVKKRVMKMIEKEEHLAALPGFIAGSAESPQRFDIPLEALNYAIRTRRKISITPRILPLMLSTVKGIFTALNEAPKNPENVKTQVSEEFLREIKEYAQTLGIGDIGFVKIPDRYIFKNKAVRYRNAIICSMKMDKEKIDTAPSYESLVEIQKTYHDLGVAVIKLSRFLRKHGFGAQAIHPLGGQIMLVPLAREANIGWVGHQGLIISPQYGPCMRLAAVVTSIENLPFTTAETNPHSWIEEWCELCKACVRACPGKAILDPTQQEPNGHKHYIEIDKCFPHFIEEYGCSICIKVCPFTRVGYDKVKSLYLKKRRN